MSLRVLTLGGLARFCLVFALVYSTLFAALLFSGDAYCRGLRPLFLVQTRLFAAADADIELSCQAASRLKPTLEYKIGTPRPMPGGGVGIRRQKGGVNLLPLAQNAAVLGALVLAWPGCALARRLVLFVASQAALHLIFIADAPMAFLADPLPALDLRERWLQLWTRFSHNGGHLLLLFCVYAATLLLLLRAPRGDVAKTEKNS